MWWNGARLRSGIDPVVVWWLCPSRCRPLLCVCYRSSCDGYCLGSFPVLTGGLPPTEAQYSLRVHTRARSLFTTLPSHTVQNGSLPDPWLPRFHKCRTRPYLPGWDLYRGDPALYSPVSTPSSPPYAFSCQSPRLCPGLLFFCIQRIHSFSILSSPSHHRTFLF